MTPSLRKKAVDEQRDAVQGFLACIVKTMEQKQISRTELARRLGTSRAYVSLTLNNAPNITFKTAAEFAVAVGLRFRFTSK